MPLFNKVLLDQVTPVRVVPANTRRKRISFNPAPALIGPDANSVRSSFFGLGIPASLDNYTGEIWALASQLIPKGTQQFLTFIEEYYPDVAPGFTPTTLGFIPDSNNYSVGGPFINQGSGMVSDPTLVGMRDFTLQVSSSGGGSYTIVSQGSLDGLNWYPLPVAPGSPNNGSTHPLVANITSDGLYLFLGVPVNQARFNLTSLTSGATLTALLSTK